MKDLLLLTFHGDPKSFTKAINQVVGCDNHLFEQRFKHQQWSQPRSKQHMHP